MTQYLRAAAAKEYLLNTILAWELGLIPKVHCDARLHALRSLAAPNNVSAGFALELLDGDKQFESTWLDDIESEVELEGGMRAKGGAEIGDRGVDSDQDITLAFRMGSGPLRKWVFHQADDDFFPSIPHGHFLGGRQPKLDAYLGWVYRGSQQIDRVPRGAIVRLWNDPDFRDFARSAIEYYLARYPQYCGWRVKNPRRLPAIRRGRRYR